MEVDAVEDGKLRVAGRHPELAEVAPVPSGAAGLGPPLADEVLQVAVEGEVQYGPHAEGESVAVPAGKGTLEI